MFSFYLPCRAQNTTPVTKVQNSTPPGRVKRTISFSGYQWTVRDIAGKEGPGPNLFAGSSVQVDDKGWLHLWIKKDSITGQWQCAEITSQNYFKYGTYQFIVEGSIDQFDKNVVLGLFNYSGNDGFDEIDIEIARWGNNSFPNLNYTIWPANKGFKNSAATKEFSLHSKLSTHYFRWSADTVICASFDNTSTDPKNQVFSSTFTSPTTSISQLAMPVHINLWLFGGNPPLDGKPVEVVIRSFRFTP